jgi:hypothetical protein
MTVATAPTTSPRPASGRGRAHVEGAAQVGLVDDERRQARREDRRDDDHQVEHLIADDEFEKGDGPDGGGDGGPRDGGEGAPWAGALDAGGLAVLAGRRPGRRRRGGSRTRPLPNVDDRQHHEGTDAGAQRVESRQPNGFKTWASPPPTRRGGASHAAPTSLEQLDAAICRWPSTSVMLH